MNPLFSTDDFKLNKLSSQNPHANQNEHTLSYFWRHINLTYFRKLGPQELERFNYILTMLSQPLSKTEEPKYSDYNSYFLVKNCLNKNNVLKKFEKKEVASQYYQTLLKHIKLSNQIYNAATIVEPQKLDKLYNKKMATMKPLSAKTVVGSLNEENRQIDLISKRLNKLVLQKSTVEDQIDQEIMKLEDEFKTQNKQNQQRITSLQERVEQVQPFPFMNELPQRVLHHKYWQKKHRKNKSRSLDLSDQSANQIQLEFIKSTILKLEQRQLSDSISKIVQTVPQQGGGYQYNVALEQALNTNFQAIEEPLLNELDKMRDISLFKFYNIPQKTRYSHIAHNYYSIQYVAANRLKPNTLLTKNVQTLMKQQTSLNQPIDQITSKFDSCHHCRQLFREDNLMTCNYRSGTMGLPIINSAIQDPYMLQQIDNENNIQNPNNRRFLSNRKRNTYSMYARKNGELICSRKFCRQCLKQCYEYNLTETTAKNDWVCPFCQGICYCVRCQRNDILTKLKGMYMVLGGNMQELQESSLLERYVRPQQEEFYYRKKQQSHGFQRTGNSFFRQQFNNFKNMQQVRVDFENLRHLCSCVNKREKIKRKEIDNQYQLWLSQKNENKKSKKKQVREVDDSESSIIAEITQPKITKTKQKYERKQNDRIEKTKNLIQKFYPRHQHNPNSPPEDVPQIKLKRELSQLILTQDAETYNLVVKKIKAEFSP